MKSEGATVTCEQSGGGRSDSMNSEGKEGKKQTVSLEDEVKGRAEIGQHLKG